jgi:hypothetical protein
MIVVEDNNENHIAEFSKAKHLWIENMSSKNLKTFGCLPLFIAVIEQGFSLLNVSSSSNILTAQGS